MHGGNREQPVTERERRLQSSLERSERTAGQNGSFLCARSLCESHASETLVDECEPMSKCDASAHRWQLAVAGK